ncbi:zonula occludens toxin (Zot) family protein [Campylobacter iguaniorum]|uniref:zonular occludens toxin domain-containing protein n=1 Tax=Campylobacter iguaniorum TaxID=1244531 RepID=UPI0007C95A5B|nr:zonular occludens toxin domain-containing protein [Campylobacter iguaniorum]ANE35838.1 zonula occludens toxin (Zot) family protein [Campylobacter iguaniorum]
MSIHYIIGNPGSGKTFYGVNVLYESFIKKPKSNLLTKFIKSNDEVKKYDIAYTNINQFDFTKSDKIQPLVFSEILSKLTLLYNEYKFNQASDEVLIQKSKELNLYNALFVIDEIHNFFNEKENEVFIWWLTYHRHLYQELYLITQDLSLVNSEYKRIAEFFYKAVDSSKRFFSKKFRYIQYSNYKLYQKDVVRTFHVDFSDECFNLYHSGKNGVGSSFVKKYLLLSLMIAIITAIFFSIFVLYMTPDIPENKPIQDFNSTSKPINKPTIKINTDDLFFYQIECVFDDCHFLNSDQIYDKKIIKFLLNKTEIVYQSIKYRAENLETISYFIKDDVFKVLNIKFRLSYEDKKGLTDEKTSFNSLFGSDEPKRKPNQK